MLKKIGERKKGLALLIIGIIVIIISIIPLITNFGMKLQKTDKNLPNQITYISYSINKSSLQDQNFNNEKYAYVGKNMVEIQYMTILSFKISNIFIKDISNIKLEITGYLDNQLLNNTDVYVIFLYVFENEWNAETITWNDESSIIQQPVDYCNLNKSKTEQKLTFNSQTWTNNFTKSGNINFILKMNNVPINDDAWICYNFKKDSIHLTYVNGYLNNEASFVLFGILAFISLVLISVFIGINTVKNQTG